MSEVATGSVAEDVGNLKRSIQMKLFGTAKAKKKAQETDEHEKFIYPKGLAVGQIVGEIFDVKEKSGTLPSGEVKMSLLAIGSFEAIVYETGEVMESTAAYLPGYYLDTVKSMLDRGANAIAFAVEIVLVPTGKSIPLAYEVKNLIRRRPDNVINKLKAEMAASKVLRLPPPTETAAPDPDEVLAIEAQYEDVTPDDDVADAASPATAATETSPAPKGGKKEQAAA
jgi:hypothetical protein